MQDADQEAVRLSSHLPCFEGVESDQVLTDGQTAYRVCPLREVRAKGFRQRRAPLQADDTYGWLRTLVGGHMMSSEGVECGAQDPWNLSHLFVRNP